MGSVLQFKRLIQEPFRLDGQADRVAGIRTRGLLTTQEALVEVIDLRKSDPSRELKKYEAMLRRKLARERAYLETLDEAFGVAQLAAPEILSEFGGRATGTLVVLKRDRRSKEVKSAAAFSCRGRGVVLVAHQMLIVPKRAVPI